MFNLFGKKEKGPAFSDRAFMNAAGKTKACIQLAKTDPSTVFAAWFPDTLRNFRSLFLENGLEEMRVVDARHLHSAMLSNKNVVFAEHYPIHERELNLVQNWDQKKFIVYSSMDEPLFKLFGSDKMLPLMKMLGMKEDEAIEHAMVSKSIIKAQDKIASKVDNERPANSQQEWMLLNLPDADTR